MGEHNTAIGEAALVLNTTGNFNTATGAGALNVNTTASFNTADGFFALRDTTGERNTAVGFQALVTNQTGTSNTATGFQALLNNTTGSRNIALGFNAGVNLSTGDSNIDIGNAGGTGDAGTIRIGVQGTQTRTFVAGIIGSPITGTSVVVNSTGRLGTVASSQRFKESIHPMDKASEAILSLKPVTFRYKEEIDPDGIPQFGLIAEEVEKVSPNLVVRDADGKVNTVRYEAVNAMLLNEFLKEHRQVQEQKATIAQLKSAVARQQKQIEQLTAGLQKVSAQIEVNKTAPQIVLNNQ
jgi:Chaperone of endosialidase